MRLDDVVSMSAVNPVRGPDGWMFGDGDYADSLNGFRRLREAYEATDQGYEGRVSIPVLWDRKQRRIVSTESSEIMRMFGGDTLCPKPLRAEIDALNAWIGERINDGVYDVGKATSQPAYERGASQAARRTRRTGAAARQEALSIRRRAGRE
jgi:putative glutathione S-transferase